MSDESLDRCTDLTPEELVRDLNTLTLSALLLTLYKKYTQCGELGVGEAIQVIKQLLEKEYNMPV